MLRIIHLKNDLKQILRDPIMAILIVAPLLLIIAFKLMVLYLVPFIPTLIEFDVLPYFDYVLVFVVMMCGAMLGIVTGFMMIDDRDGKIAELMSVTPLGRSGYLINRLLFAAVLSVFYSILGYYVLNVIELPFVTILFVSLLSSIYSIIIGLLIFTFADDKVKGLTFAKAINSLSLFAFTDLLALKWLTVLSWFFPPYWISLVVQSPHTLLNYGLALLVNFGWLFLLISHYWKKES
jgi:fluoroquinolone transport system permease protein